MDLFGTAGIRGSVEATVTPELALSVGQAVGQDGGPVVVGRDGRRSSPALASALEAGLASVGASVVRAGVVPTPTLAFTSRGRRGIMVTGSHNPPLDNGIKLFEDGREYDGEAERTIEDRVEDGPEPASWDRWVGATSTEPLPAYRSAVVEYLRDHGTDASDLTVAVDCGNGMASLATPSVLDELGASVRALEANVDGSFPARASKPTAESLRALRSFVANTEVDLGIGHDGDADRVVLVDRHGEVVHEDTVLAIVAGHYVRRADVDDPVVVTTPNASARIDEVVEDLGGRVERTRLGALHEGIEAATGTVVFAGEPWKHVHPAFGDWIDGVVSAGLLVRLVAGTDLETRREAIAERPYRKVNVDCPDGAKRAVMDDLETALPAAFPDATIDTDYGVRLDVPDGAWVLVRPSGTEPFVRIYAESEDVDSLVNAVRAHVEDAVSDAQ